jgi:hypothetical protein
MIISKQEINWCFQGQGYDQTIKVTYGLDVILYSGNCDSFITSEYGEIHMNLSFDSHSISPHILRVFGEQVLIMPSIYLLSKDVTYFSEISQTCIVHKDVLKSLWNDLRYDSTEIDTLINVNKDDLMLFWFANIKKINLDRPVKKIAKWLTERIVAESYGEYSQASKIIKLYIDNIIIFDDHLLHCVYNSEAIVTYIDNDGSTIEWNSLDVLNRSQIILKDRWRLNIMNI